MGCGTSFLLLLPPFHSRTHHTTIAAALQLLVQVVLRPSKQVVSVCAPTLFARVPTALCPNSTLPLPLLPAGAEVQPGSYILSDFDYSKNEGGGEWLHSLFILSTVMSVCPSERRAVMDAGLKCMSADSGPPRFDDDHSYLEVQGLADEHSKWMPRTRRGTLLKNCWRAH